MDDFVVCIVDDSPGVRQALSLLLEAEGFSTYAFDSAEAFLDRLDEIDPGCLLVDVRMPGTDGMHLLNQLHREHPDIPFIMMSGHGDIPLAVKAIKSGALDFLEKPFSAVTLINAIGQCRQKRVDEQKEHTHKHPSDAINRLTPREREVLRLLVAGQQNKQIAAELGISSRTVEVHRARLKHKLGARTVPELVRLALEAGDNSSGFHI